MSNVADSALGERTISGIPVAAEHAAITLSQVRRDILLTGTLVEGAKGLRDSILKEGMW
jgi:hypothetical protein